MFTAFDSFDFEMTLKHLDLRSNSSLLTLHWARSLRCTPSSKYNLGRDQVIQTHAKGFRRLVPVLIISAGLRITWALDASTPPPHLWFQPDSYTTTGYSLISAEISLSVTREKKEANIIRAESKKNCGRRLNAPTGRKWTLVYIWKRQGHVLFDGVTWWGVQWHLRCLRRTGHVLCFQHNASTLQDIWCISANSKMQVSL